MQTSVFIERIQSFLDDLQLQGRISQSVYRKKRAPGEIITALNLADIEICGELKLRKQTAAFIPKGATHIYLRIGDQYKEKHVVSGVDSDTFKANVRNLAVFLNEESYLDVSAITSSALYLYENYPPDSYGHATEVPMIISGKQHTSSRLAAVQYPDGNLLVLTQPLEDDMFAVFEAIILPAFYELKPNTTKENIEKYRIRTPDGAHQLLLYRTMMVLLPGEEAALASILPLAQQAEARAHSRQPGSGTTAYTPTGSYNFSR